MIRKVLLIGSSRFKKLFLKKALELEKSGKLVLMMSFFGHADSIEITAEERALLQQVDMARIDLLNSLDTVLVINGLRNCCIHCQEWYDNWDVCRITCKCGKVCTAVPYYGQNTRVEVEYCLSKGLDVTFLYDPPYISHT